MLLLKGFNELCIADIYAKITELFELEGDFINLQYTLPSGQSVKLWDDDKIYYSAEVHKQNSERCYGLTASVNMAAMAPMLKLLSSRNIARRRINLWEEL